MVLSLNPEETGFTAVAGAGTELGAVGTLTELPSRGWCCHRALMKLALLPSLGVVWSPNPKETGIVVELRNLEAILKERSVPEE